MTNQVCLSTFLCTALMCRQRGKDRAVHKSGFKKELTALAERGFSCRVPTS